MRVARCVRREGTGLAWLCDWRVPKAGDWHGLLRGDKPNLQGLEWHEADAGAEQHKQLERTKPPSNLDSMHVVNEFENKSSHQPTFKKIGGGGSFHQLVVTWRVTGMAEK